MPGMPRHGVPGDARIETGRRRRRRPVRTRRREQSGSGRRHLRMRTHQIDLGRAVMVGRHEQLRLVLVGGRVGGRRLHRLGESGEVIAIGVALAVHLRHDVLVVVVAKGPTQLVVVHVRLALPLAPAPSHLVRVDQLELAARALPRDAARVAAVRK